jgi:tetratricopeptide (TPR) repeat protein
MNRKLGLAALAATLVVAGCTNANLVGGRNYVDQGVYDKAVAVLEKAVQELPEDPEAHFLLGKSYAATENYAKAAAELDRASQLDPRFYALRADTVRQDTFAKLFNGAGELLNANQYAQALERYQTASLFASKTDVKQQITVHQNLGYVYTKLGRRDEAIKEYMTIYQLDPTNVDALKTTLQLHIDAGERAKAMAICKDIVAQRPGDVLVTSTLADMYMEDADAARDRGDVDGQRNAIREALPLWEAILAAKPDDMTAQYQIGVCYYTLEDFAQAGDNFEKVVDATDPKDQLHVDALSNYAASLYKLKQFGSAETQIRELIALEPGECGHYRLLSGALREQGRTNEALDAAKKYEECSERNKR